MSGPEAGVFIVTTVFAGTLGLTWVRAHYKSLTVTKSEDLTRIEERLARIEQALDAVAVEAERISEGQRFTTKLLSDRAPARRAE